MKKVLLISVLVGLFCASGVFAQTGSVALANHVIAYQRENVGLPEGSSYKFGVASRTYSFDRDGDGTGGLDLSGAELPDNAIMLYSTIEVLTRLEPATSTNSLGYQTATDILAAGTNLSSAAGTLIDGVADWTAANAVKMTAERELTLTTTGSAITAGVFKVWTFWVQGQ